MKNIFRLTLLTFVLFSSLTLSSCKKLTGELIEQAIKQMSKKGSREVGEEVLKQGAKSSTRKAGQEALEQGVKHSTAGAIHHGTIGLSDDVAEKIFGKTSQEVSDDIAERVFPRIAMENIDEASSTEVIDELSDEISKELPLEFTIDTASKSFQDSFNNQLSKQFYDRFYQDISSSLSAQISREFGDEIPKELIESFSTELSDKLRQRLIQDTFVSIDISVRARSAKGIAAKQLQPSSYQVQQTVDQSITTHINESLINDLESVAQQNAIAQSEIWNKRGIIVKKAAFASLVVKVVYETLDEIDEEAD